MFSQRLSSAINIHSPVMSFIRYENNYYSPDNLTRIYFVTAPEEKEKKFAFSPINTKYHFRTGIGIGYLLKLDYKWFAVRIGAQTTYQYSTLKFQEFDYDTDIARYKQVFTMHSLNTTFPVLFSADLKRKNNSYFAIWGAEAGYYTVVTERIDDINYDKDHLYYMYGVFYNDKIWTNLNFGLGKKWKAIEWYFVYKHRIDSGKKDLTIKNSLVEFNFNVYLGYSKVKKNHYLFRE